MSIKRRTVEPPEELRTLLDNIKALPFDAKSPEDLYGQVEREMSGKSMDEVTKAFHQRIEDLLNGTTMRALGGREAAHAYADLFAMQSVLALIAIVTDHGIGYLLQREERITPEALLNFWDTSPLGDLATSGLTLRHLNSEPFSTLVKDRLLWRIRQCWQCQTLFWAGRVDKLTCSSRCGDARRQLLVRQRKKERGAQYRENVKAHRDRKKAGRRDNESEG